MIVAPKDGDEVPTELNLKARGNGVIGFRAILAILASVVALLAIPAAAQATNVYAAASLREVFQKVDGSDAVTYNFAGSGALQKQIEEGAPADVFASASPDEAQALFAAGRCERPVTFATNEVAILVPPGNPSGVESIYSFQTGNRKLAIGVAGVPIGKYTREVLSAMGLIGILDTNTVSQEPNVTGITSKVALGEVDAGIAYVTDGMIVANQGVGIIRLPEGSQPKVRYQICVVIRDGADTAGAETYIEKVRGETGRNLLSEAGFGLPPDPAEVAKKQQLVEQAQTRVAQARQGVRMATKNKNQVCRKARKAKRRKAGNAKKLHSRCNRNKKKLSRTRKNLTRANEALVRAAQELKEAEDALINA